MSKSTKRGNLFPLIHWIGIAVMSAALSAAAASPAFCLQIGDAAPAFDLPGVDGRNHSLEDFRGKKATVVIFSCNSCPYVRAYENRIIAIQADYADRDVQVVAINANDADRVPADSFENMQKRAREKNFNFPYLYDETQAVAHAYDATRTPHIYLFDENFILRYTGKIDDNWEEPSQVSKTYLRDALDAVLGGDSPAEPETYAIGCTIKWKR